MLLTQSASSQLRRRAVYDGFGAEDADTSGTSHRRYPPEEWGPRSSGSVRAFVGAPHERSSDRAGRIDEFPSWRHATEFLIDRGGELPPNCERADALRDEHAENRRQGEL